MQPKQSSNSVEFNNEFLRHLRHEHTFYLGKNPIETTITSSNREFYPPIRLEIVNLHKTTSPTRLSFF